MSSIYENIKTPKELIASVRAHGLSTKVEDICKAQDIFGHAPLEELVKLAQDNGRLKGFNGEPDPRGTVSSGREGDSKIFYQILFHIWHWEDATRFYNQYSNFPIIDKLNEVDEMNKRLKKAEQKAEEMGDQFDTAMNQYGKLLAQYDEMEKAKLAAEQKTQEAEQEIIRLKAKLYDLMEKGE